MKRIVLLFSTALFVTVSFAQKQTADSAKMVTKPAPPPPPAPATTPKKKDWSKINLSNRANDHFLMQIGYDGWAQQPDTIHTKGFSRSFNVYLMYDFPFKTDPRFSVGVGVGVGSSNIFFNNQEVLVTSLTGTLPFPDRSQTDHFKKYKLVTTYAEVPVELRFVADPEHNSKSWKGAVGVKIGTLLDAHTKGKNLLNSTGSTLNTFIEKESSKRYFNTTRLAASGRIGYGHISIFGQFQINNFIKDGVGPPIHPFSVGITFSGL
jgi:Outer membrane protein beta-barrel domain